MPDQPATGERHARNKPGPQLRLLGSFDLSIAGEPVGLPPKAQQVLAFLALRGQAGRSRLAGSLWPDVSEGHARSNLRTAVWRINRSGARWVTSLNGSLALTPDLDVDVHDFISMAEGFLTREAASSHDVLRLIRAPIELLPDWDAPWLDADRDHLRELLLQLCEVSAHRLIDSGQHGLALATSLAAVRTDPLRESAHRLVIGIHVAQGDLAEASRRYHALERVLRSEMGVGPCFTLEDLDARFPVTRSSPPAGRGIV